MVHWFPTGLSKQGTGWNETRLALVLLATGLELGRGSLGLAAAPVDVSRLPPPAEVRVNFVRDIRPLLERSCWRCHGPERPKSGLRLDNREAALRGGDEGVVIVAGNSAASRLVHFVAQLPEVDEDFWMPPAGKTPRLTRDEVALVRAWIDQGVAWGDDAGEPRLTLAVAPTAGWTAVSGNAGLFREHHWLPEGWNGGLERFRYRQELDDRTRATAEGRLLLNDYRIRWQVERRDLGFVRGGFEQFRKYYGERGGYVEAFTPPSFSLDRDLHLDTGRVWADVGLTLPNWPRLTLGYERQFKEGAKSLTSWSPVSENGETRNIQPNAKGIDEGTHLLKFNLDHEIQGLRLENDFRAEWSRLRTARTNTAFFPPERTGALLLDQVRETRNQFQADNAFRLEKQVTSWFFGSGGYLYHHYDAEGSFRLDESFVGNSFGPARRWRSPTIALEQDAHVGNVNGQLGPWHGWTAAMGLQGEWNRQRGWGQASFDLDFGGGGILVGPTTQRSAIDQASLIEHFGLRYTRIPYTVLFAEGQFRQESLGHYEEQPGGDYPVRRDSDSDRDVRDWRVGFHTSPWARISLASHYRRINKSVGYDHVVDVLPAPFGEGYPAFIQELVTDTDEVEARLSYRWTTWLKTALTYRLVAGDSHAKTDPVAGFDPVASDFVPGGTTPGARLLAGNHDAHSYSVNATVRPFKRLSLNATFSVRDDRTANGANDSSSVAVYHGRTYSVISSASYVWNERTDLLSHYAFAHADYRQDNAAAGLPLGIQYQQHNVTAGLRRRLSDRVSLTLRYGFFLYDESSAGGFNDYTAHLVFSTLSFRLP